MERFLKRRAVEHEAPPNRDADKHAKVPPEKGDGLLRYMSKSSVASIEVASAVRDDDAKKKKLRKEAAALIASTGCSQAVAAKHLSIKYENVIGLCSPRGRVLNFSDYRSSHWITKLGLP